MPSTMTSITADLQAAAPSREGEGDGDWVVAQVVPFSLETYAHERGESEQQERADYCEEVGSREELVQSSVLRVQRLQREQGVHPENQ